MINLEDKTWRADKIYKISTNKTSCIPSYRPTRWRNSRVENLRCKLPLEGALLVLVVVVYAIGDEGELFQYLAHLPAGNANKPFANETVKFKRPGLKSATLINVIPKLPLGNST